MRKEFGIRKAMVGMLTGTTATVTVSENLTLFFSPLSFLVEDDEDELPGC